MDTITRNNTERKYISCTDTAKLVRKALKKNFPNVKFSVRSSSYSGGASIDVSWTDGPVSQRVDKVIKPFAGSTFDGMIDLKSYVDSEYEGKPVHFAADYVFSQRDISDFSEKMEAATKLVNDNCNVVNGRFGNDRVEELARKVVYYTDDEKGQTFEDGLRIALDPSLYLHL